VSGLSRYVRILRLFDERRGEWTIPEMAVELGVPASTVYRTVREMLAGGFLEAANEAHYRLGSCFIEFDRLIRVTDPLYVAGIPLLREIVVQARVPCVAVLARLYNDTVMCVADMATPGGEVRTSYERGKPRPLTRGATSKVILAQLPSRKLSRLLTQPGVGDDEHDPEKWIPAFGKDDAPRKAAHRNALRDELAAIRKRGYSVTRSEVDLGNVGIAAPVVLPARSLVGSLSLVLEASSVDAAVERRMTLLVVSTASLLTEELLAASATMNEATRAAS
jgi:DNA-binding IclR family transcriptional regulator